MKPTVYLPLADLCPTGLRRPSASSIARFRAGRISARRMWIETEGQRLGSKYDRRNQTAGGSGPKRTG
ncbi:MAG TPA: hypothetical protein VFZ21_14525 [Gemmatimonadaceae bacterium]|jgi:hypothetical protein|nr:hypothetical protein [Gemmatimonadaceae bacterium]